MNISNSQCTIRGASASKSGAILTLTVSLGFQGAWGGNVIHWLSSRTVGGSVTPWTPEGVWGVTPLPTTNPSAFAMTPAVVALPTSSYSVFSATVSDTGGMADLGIVNLLINSGFDGRQACFIAYDSRANVLYLVEDNGATTDFVGAPGWSATKSNSQCTVDALHSSVSVTGKQLVLNLSLKFSTSFTGPRIAYLAARSVNDVTTSGWQSLGLYTGGVAATSGTVSISSFSGPTTVPSNTASTFVFPYADTAGSSDIAGGQFSFPPSTGSDACLVEWDVAGGVGLLTSTTAVYGYLGQAAMLSSTACSVDLSASSLLQTGSGYSLALRLSFPGGFLGTHAVYALGENDAGQGANIWQRLGSVVVSNSLPSVSCVGSPNPVSAGQLVTFTAIAVSGTPPYSYAWSSGATGSGQTITFQAQANAAESIVVTDHKGRTSFGSCAVVVQTPLTLLVPSKISSGSNVTVTVVIGTPAPAGGGLVTLGSSSLLPLPPTVLVGAGKTTASVVARSANTSGSVTVTATYNGASRNVSATLLSGPITDISELIGCMGGPGNSCVLAPGNYTLTNGGNACAPLQPTTNPIVMAPNVTVSFGAGTIEVNDPIQVGAGAIIQGASTTAFKSNSPNANGTILHRGGQLCDSGIWELAGHIPSSPLTGVTVKGITFCGGYPRFGDILPIPNPCSAGDSVCVGPRDPSTGRPTSPRCSPIVNVTGTADHNSGIGDLLSPPPAGVTPNLIIQNNWFFDSSSGPIAIATNYTDQFINDVVVVNNVIVGGGVQMGTFAAGPNYADSTGCDAWPGSPRTPPLPPWSYAEDPQSLVPNYIRFDTNRFYDYEGAISGFARHLTFTGNVLTGYQSSNPDWGGQIEQEQCSDTVNIVNNKFIGNWQTGWTGTSALELYGRNTTVTGNTITTAVQDVRSRINRG